MKKIITALCSALIVVILAFTLAGCATNVEGKTYEYDSYTVSYDDKDISEDGKKLLDGAITALLSPLKLVKYEFQAEGVVKVSGVPGKYTQDGKEVTVNGDKLTVSGNKLQKNVKGTKFTLTVTYKKV